MNVETVVIKTIDGMEHDFYEAKLLVNIEDGWVMIEYDDSREQYIFNKQNIVNISLVESSKDE